MLAYSLTCLLAYPDPGPPPPQEDYFGFPNVAGHLPKKVLVKNHLDRASVQAILKHAYLCGGMDTVQRDSSFGYLQQTQQQLQSLLAEISTQVKN